MLEKVPDFSADKEGGRLSFNMHSTHSLFCNLTFRSRYILVGPATVQGRQENRCRKQGDQRWCLTKKTTLNNKSQFPDLTSPTPFLLKRRFWWTYLTLSFLHLFFPSFLPFHTFFFSPSLFCILFFDEAGHMDLVHAQCLIRLQKPFNSTPP